jgi:16S rRNA (guanine966-N2)-methyltransferase
MRITTGLYKGRTILTVKDYSVRPATDRVRQTIFNMITSRISLDGIRVLDLFAGSGSLGLEALSRGAAHATFVEQNEEAAEVIERTIALFGCADRAQVLPMDAMHFAGAHRVPFHLVFADPPYVFDGTKDIPGLLFGNGILTPGGYLVIEHADDLAFESTTQYTAGPVKKFGRTRVTFFRQAAIPEDGK